MYLLHALGTLGSVLGTAYYVDTHVLVRQEHLE